MGIDRANLQSPSAPHRPVAVFRATVAALVLLISAMLLFAHLGHYALWDDEAITALTAKGVWQTGDTSAVVGHNIVAFRNGLLLRDLKDRATPPLQFYLAAPFIGWMGDSAVSARLGFALCGMGCVGLMLWWLNRDHVSTTGWIVTGLAIVGNVSFFLFSRQARYYGLAMLLAVAVAYVYFHLRTRRGVIVLSILSVLLLAANYMTFAAVVVMLGIDYLLFGKHHKRLSTLDLSLLIVPPLVIGAVIVSIWNPLRIAEPRPQFSWLQWHSKLLWWNVRDLNYCEFGSGVLLIAAPIVALSTRSQPLTRALLALAVGILVISTITPQNPSDSPRADVRYLSFLMPLCIAIGAMTVVPLARISRILAVVSAVVAFGTNLLNFSPITEQPIQSTLVKYITELRHPVPEPYTLVVHWIRQNVTFGQSIFVLPDYMMYPLMFHAPDAVYAWQLDHPPREDLYGLPAIHTKMVIPPEYVIVFGPSISILKQIPFESPYEPAGQIDVFWRDLYRPELFWRAFEPLPQFDRRRESIYIFRRVREPSSFRL